MVRPADYRPPISPAEAIVEPTDPPDERIEVGVLVVGAGPAGLACAIRLGQLLEESPALAERLGEVPVAVLDKGAKPGAHLLSGAVVNPISLRALFAGRRTTADMPFFDRVEHESVYFLTKHRAYRIPAPPTMRNHGNYVASLSQLGRWLAEEAEALGVTVLPETSAEKLLVSHGRVTGVRTGDRGRARDGQPLARFEPGSDIAAQVTVLAEGTQGYLTAAAIDQFGLRGRNPQVWALGVKEVWRVTKPLRKVIHTMGWPLRARQALPRVRRLVHLPDGRGHGHARHGRRARLPRRVAIRARPLAGAEDPQARAEDPRRRRAHRVGCEDDPGGRLLLAPLEAARARSRPLWRRRRIRERARAQGHPLRRRVGRARRGGDRGRATVPARRSAGTVRLPATTRRCAQSFVTKDLKAVRNMRQAFAKGFWMGSREGGDDDDDAAAARLGRRCPPSPTRSRS